MTPGVTHLIPVPNPVGKFWLTNLCCVVVLAAIRLWRRARLYSPFQLIDLGMTAVFGIYGLIASLLFPNRF